MSGERERENERDGGRAEGGRMIEVEVRNVVGREGGHEGRNGRRGYS